MRVERIKDKPNKVKHVSTKSIKPIHPDTLLLGTGRSGTSFTAEILHNHFNVCMGHKNKENTSLKFHKYYEDKPMFDATILLCGRFGEMNTTRKGDPIYTKTWLSRFASSHVECSNLYKGTKNKHLCWLSSKQLIEINPRLIVRTYRPIESSAISFYENQKPKKKKSYKCWLETLTEAEENLVQLEKDVGDIIPFVQINFTSRGEPRISKESVIESLEPYIEEYVKCHQN